MQETQAQKDARMDWWRKARFGMFIHWGLYSIPAGRWDGKTVDGPSEWLLYHAKVKVADYEPLLKQFDPVKFDARAWARLAKRAGVKYVVITSKHHEGFALWPTQQSDWSVAHTPFHRDILKELSDACRTEGIRFCTYHSIMDWHHPDYLPRREWDPRPGVPADFDRYVTYLKAQLKEIVTNYHPAIMWFDGEWEDTWTHARGKDLYAYVRSLDPNIIVNNRVDNARNGSMEGMSTIEDAAGDYGTPEQTIPPNGLPGVDWESCMTMNDSWGYKADDHNWKPATTLIHDIIDCASKGGNYLLNVGPTAEGLIPPESVQRLEAIGRWMDVNGEAIYDTQASPFRRPFAWGRVTRKPGRLYIHVFEAPDGLVRLPGLKNEVQRAYLLSDKDHALAVHRDPNGVTVDLPALKDAAATVAVLEIAGEPLVEDIAQRPDAAGNLTLAAADADTHGPNLRYEADKHSLGYWTSADASASWDFEVTQPGTFDIALEQACDRGTAGAEYEVTIAGSSLKGTVKETGSWTSFERVPLGAVTIERPGRYTLAVRPIHMSGYAVMNLRGVSLRRRS